MVSAVFQHDPAEIRRWAEKHGIGVADAPEPAEPAAVDTGPAHEPEPREPARDARVAARAEQDQLAREAATLARRVTRLEKEAHDYEAAIAERKILAGELAHRVARLGREAARLQEQNEDTRSRMARRAAEDAKAVALARRVVQVLEDDRDLDPFTAALAALAQRRRRLGEVTEGDDPRLAGLAEAIQLSAERRARVRQLQIRQIGINKSHGPESPEADAVRRELAAERLAMVVLATLGTGLDPDDVISVALTGALPDRPGPPRLLTQAGWPVQP